MDVVERLIALVESSCVTELDFCEGGTRIRILRTVSSDAAPEDRVGSSSPPDPGRGAADDPARPHQSVAAGIVGTFFRCPGPGQPPFVQEGDLVEEGQTLAILEAMKTLNPVEADRAGRIRRILVADGMSVEAGTPLFVLEV